MSFLLKRLVPLLITFVLIGCKEQQTTVTYLMQHPDVLKEKVEQCDSQSIVEKSQEQITQCKMVMTAASNLMSIMNAQQRDPEQFGQHILDAEMACAKAKHDLIDARKKLDALKKKNAQATELKGAIEKLMQAQTVYQEKRNEVKVLLAVIGMNSPE